MQDVRGVTHPGLNLKRKFQRFFFKITCNKARGSHVLNGVRQFARKISEDILYTRLHLVSIVDLGHLF